MNLKNISLISFFFSACTTTSAPKEEFPKVPDIETLVPAVQLAPPPAEGIAKSGVFKPPR